jgi:hypothetical protein
MPLSGGTGVTLGRILRLMREAFLRAILRSDGAGCLHIALPKDFEQWPVVLVAHSSW